MDSPTMHCPEAGAGTSAMREEQNESRDLASYNPEGLAMYTEGLRAK
jgi:hypothetical protein